MFGAEAITDEAVRSAATGSPADCNRVIDALGPQVRAMIIARLAPNAAQFHAVDDLSQQALMAVTEGLQRLEDTTVAGLRSFTSVVVHHKVADFIRQIDPVRSPPAASLDSSFFERSVAGPLRGFLPASSLSPRSAAAQAESVRQVIVALGGMKPDYRSVITFAFYDQLPMVEIAERMEMSRPAVSMLLMRAVRALRRDVTGSGEIHEAGGPEGTSHAR